VLCRRQLAASSNSAPTLPLQAFAASCPDFVGSFRLERYHLHLVNGVFSAAVPKMRGPGRLVWLVAVLGLMPGILVAAIDGVTKRVMNSSPEMRHRFADSVEVNGKCYCATTFDHDIGPVLIRGKSIRYAPASALARAMEHVPRKFMPKVDASTRKHYPTSHVLLAPDAQLCTCRRASVHSSRTLALTEASYDKNTRRVNQRATNHNVCLTPAQCILKRVSELATAVHHFGPSETHLAVCMAIDGHRFEYSSPGTRRIQPLHSKVMTDTFHEPQRCLPPAVLAQQSNPPES
jgi:hypothetical protein